MKKIVDVVTCVLLVALGGCSTTFDVKVPSSKVDKFFACMKDPSTSYKEKDAASRLVTPLAAERTFARQNPTQFILDSDVKDDDAPKKVLKLSAKDLEASFVKPQEAYAKFEEVIQATADFDSIWSHPVHQAFLSTYNKLVVPISPNAIEEKGAPEVTINAKQLNDYVDRMRSLTNRSGWGAASYGQAQVLSRGLTSDQSQLVSEKLFASLYISTYIDAYFKNGRFAQLKWNLGSPLDQLQLLLKGTNSGVDQEFLNKAIKALRSVDKDAAAKLEAIIEKSYSGTFGKIADVGLVTRGGDSLAMPAVTVSLDATQSKPITFTKVDANAVIEDLVRVVFEAIFDSKSRIPAVPNATGVKLLGAAALVDFKKTASSQNASVAPMSDEKFALVDSAGAKAQAVTVSATATAIRGLNIAALNNETLANTISATTGTIARKITEQATWCYNIAVASHGENAAAALYAHPLSEMRVTVKVNY